MTAQPPNHVTDSLVAPPPVEIARPMHAAALYYVLSHLDLGRDAASLYDATLIATPWQRGLLDAYHAAPDRLRFHFLGHWSTDYAALADELTRRSHSRGSQTADACLAASLRGALEAARPSFEAAWSADDFAPRHARFRSEIEPALQRARTALWAGVPPPLRVLDCASLGRNGRGATVDGVRVVAVSLAEPSGHVFCQLLHEETHPVTDSIVRAQFRNAAADARVQDTRVGARGYALHHALEVAAVTAGHEVVATQTPEFAEAYAVWRARFRM